MLSAVDMVWSLARRPEPVPNVAALLTDEPGVCAVSGRQVERSASLTKALGANFTDQSIYRAHSDRVGPAALWCCSGKPPATLRMWSIVAAPGESLPPSHEKCFVQDTPGLHLTNRAATGAIIDTLASPPAGEWVVSVAVSGQKHVLPYAQVNAGRELWTVRFEAVNVTSSPHEWARIITDAAHLRAAEHRAEDIREGKPTLSAIKTPGDLDAWSERANRLAYHTRTPLLDLALWCLTKEQINARTNP